MDDASLVYLSGSFVPKAQAAMPVEDRGTLFGDGVYEVLAYYGGRAFALGPHVERLRASLRAIRIAPPAEFDRLGDITDELLRRNGWRDAKAYWQITRGAAVRDTAFPTGVPPSVLIMAYPLRPLDAAAAIRTLRAVTAPDVRWQQCCIKSLMLLPNVLAHNAALDAGADTAIFVHDGVVTEGTSANFFAVRNGELWTHPLNGRILGGITRQVLLQLAAALGIPTREELFTVEQAYAADEAFVTSTTTHIQAVTQIDGRTIGSGSTGPVAQRLHAAIHERIARECDLP